MHTFAIFLPLCLSLLPTQTLSHQKFSIIVFLGKEMGFTGLRKTLHLCVEMPYSTTLCSLSWYLMPWHVGCCGQCPFTSDRHHCSHGTVGTGRTSAVTGNGHSSVAPGAHTNQKITYWSSPGWQQDVLIQGGRQQKQYVLSRENPHMISRYFWLEMKWSKEF